MADDDKKEMPKMHTFMLPDVVNQYVFPTGFKLDVTLVNYMPCIDTHMHIQSNNCAPMTLQWALVREATSKIIDVQGTTRKDLNLFSTSPIGVMAMNRMGEVGRLGTDYIAKMFMNDMMQFEIKNDLFWTFLSKERLNKFEELREKVESLLAKTEPTDEEKRELASCADEMKHTYIGQMVQRRDREYGSFHEYASYYFKQHKVKHHYIALPMDMTYAHYWGQFGFPIYIPFRSKRGNGFYFINDFNKMYFNINKSGRGFSKIDDILVEEVKDGEAPSNGVLVGDEHIDIRVLLNYDIKFSECNKNVKNLFLVKGSESQEENLKRLKEFDKKKYKHFLEKVPGENDETFEDYKQQSKKTMIAGVLYPFQMLPFYHYDPRRHTKDQKDAILEGIKKDHLFLKADKVFSSGEAAIELEELSVEDNIKEYIENNAIDNSEVKDSLLPNTSAYSFFGIKMYPKLGYTPNDYKRYPHLRDFYQFCASNKVPIISHGSPDGMTIADSHIYLREGIKNKDSSSDEVIKRANEVKDKWDYTKKSYTSLEDSHRFINETCHHPKVWEKVLNEYDLKLCFAHFGGEESWFKYKYRDKYKKNDNDKDDNKDREYWVDDIIDIICSKNNVYTDLSYFANKWWHIEKTAKNLVAKINKDGATKDKLKKRILMGSDWYMYERETGYSPGVDVYYRKMFQVLKIVSKEVGFDAWYYFAVENPLRFLGFIEEGKNKLKDCSKAMQKFNAHKQFVLKQLKDEDFVDYSGVINVDKIEEKMDHFLGSYVNLVNLEDLRDMKEGGELLINKAPKS